MAKTNTYALLLCFFTWRSWILQLLKTWYPHHMWLQLQMVMLLHLILVMPVFLNLVTNKNSSVIFHKVLSFSFNWIPSFILCFFWFIINFQFWVLSLIRAIWIFALSFSVLSVLTGITNSPPSTTLGWTTVAPFQCNMGGLWL